MMGYFILAKWLILATWWQQTPPPQTPPPQKAVSPKPATPPKRQPPPLIAPVDDVGTLKQSRPAARGGISCHGGTPFTLAVLGTDSSVGATALENPRLFWFISQDLGAGCEAKFTLMCDPADQTNASACPVPMAPVEIVLPAAVTGPIVREVEGASMHLRPGVVYRWYISVGKPSDGRSNDDLAGAFIERIEAPTGNVRPWYDSLADAYEQSLDGNDTELIRILKEIDFRVSGR